MASGWDKNDFPGLTRGAAKIRKQLKRQAARRARRGELSDREKRAGFFNGLRGRSWMY